jgi:hypothetical protein
VNKITTGLKWFGAFSGAAVPAWTFFLHVAPPLFPQISLILAAVAGAIVAIAAAYVPPVCRGSAGLPPMVRHAAALIGVALVLLIAYVVLWQEWTVASINDPEVRYQIGFGKVNWGLTTEGLKDKADPDLHLIQDWMSAHGWSSNTPGIIWKEWTINTAGLILIVIFVCGFISWTTGFSLLAKYRGTP